MRKGLLSRVLSPVLLVPVLLAAVSPDHIRTLVCRHTGVVMPEESCCPERSEPEPPTPPQLRDESCCVVKTVHLVKLVSDRQSESVGPLHHDARAGLVGSETYVAVVRSPRVRNAAAPPVGPPLVLVKHAFLI